MTLDSYTHVRVMAYEKLIYSLIECLAYVRHMELKPTSYICSPL